MLSSQIPLPTDPRVLVAILITGVFASAVAFVVQTWAQRKLPPSRVALILVTETAFGGVFGWAAAIPEPNMAPENTTVRKMR